jgi:hypothetical protein
MILVSHRAAQLALKLPSFPLEMKWMPEAGAWRMPESKDAPDQRARTR